jgi:hypothetical protein
LLKIATRHQLTSFVLYEFGARMFPDLPLLLNDEQRRALSEYVTTFVMPRRSNVLVQSAQALIFGGVQ